MSIAFQGYSLRDLYPDINSFMNTTEQTQPEEAEVVHLQSMDSGAVITRKDKFSMIGVILAVVMILVFVGVIK